MAICETVKHSFIRQDIILNGHQEERYLMVHSLEISPGQFKATHYDSEFTRAQKDELESLKLKYQPHLS